MSNVGVHDFEIPHAHVQPTRDMVIVRIPLPPSKIGSIWTADMTRDLMQHNVMAGRVVSMGPLAFTYKEDGKQVRQPIEIGDWVLFRPFAGTMIQGGKIMVNSGYRYMSSFNDIIGTIKAEHMPAFESLEWEYPEPDNKQPPAFDFSSTRKLQDNLMRS